MAWLDTIRSLLSLRQRQLGKSDLTIWPYQSGDTEIAGTRGPAKAKLYSFTVDNHGRPCQQGLTKLVATLYSPSGGVDDVICSRNWETDWPNYVRYRRRKLTLKAVKTLCHRHAGQNRYIILLLLPPPLLHVPLSSSELHIILLLVLSSTIGSHVCRFLGYVIFLQARSCHEMGFPSFFNNIQFCRLYSVILRCFFVVVVVV